MNSPAMTDDFSLDETALPQTDNPPPRHWLSRLSQLLRFAGAATLIATMYSFLMDGWSTGNDELRYLMLLGHTVGLAAIGLGSVRWLRETQSARLLLSLALISVPANFAVLGAFVYYWVASITPSAYPQYVAWQISSLPALLGIGVLALGALLPLCRLVFTILARPIAKPLTVLFLLNNLALLLPVREGGLVAIVVLVLVVLSVWTNRRIARQQISAKTHEGILALGLQYLPLALLLGRSLWLYATDFLLITAAATGLYFLLRELMNLLQSGSWTHRLAQAIAVMAALLVMPALSITLLDSAWINESLALPLSALASTAMLYDLSRATRRGFGYRLSATLLLSVNCLLNLICFDTTVAALMCLVCGGSLLGLGLQQQQRTPALAGLVLTLIGLLYQLIGLVDHFNVSNWVTLAVFGVGAILLASVLESRGEQLLPNLQRRLSHLRQWER